MQSGYRWMYQRCLSAGYRVSRCGRCQYLYHCLNILLLCINKECALIQAPKTIVKNITLINDNDNNNCICCFGNDLLIFLYFCLFVCLCTFWILLFKINESFDRIKSQHNIQKHRKPFSPQVPSNPWLTDISSLLIFYHECKNRINPSKIFSGSHAISQAVEKGQIGHAYLI